MTNLRTTNVGTTNIRTTHVGSDRRRKRQTSEAKNIVVLWLNCSDVCRFKRFAFWGYTFLRFVVPRFVVLTFLGVPKILLIVFVLYF